MKNKLNNREKHQGQSREVRGNVEKIGDPVILSLPADLRVFRYFLSCMKEIRNQKVCTDSIRNTRAKLLCDSKKTDGVVKKTAGHQLLYMSAYQHLDLGI